MLHATSSNHSQIKIQMLHITIQKKFKNAGKQKQNKRKKCSVRACVFVQSLSLATMNMNIPSPSKRQEEEKNLLQHNFYFNISFFLVLLCCSKRFMILNVQRV